MSNETYCVEPCFYPNGDRDKPLMCDRAEQQVFANLEDARAFVQEWLDECETHEAVIWQEVESTLDKRKIHEPPVPPRSQ